MGRRKMRPHAHRTPKFDKKFQMAQLAFECLLEEDSRRLDLFFKRKDELYDDFPYPSVASEAVTCFTHDEMISI